MPSDDVKGSVVLLVLEGFTTESGNNCIMFLVFGDTVVFAKRCMGSFKVSFICTSVCANWTKVRDGEVTLEYFGYPASVELASST